MAGPECYTFLIQMRCNRIIRDSRNNKGKHAGFAECRSNGTKTWYIGESFGCVVQQGVFIGRNLRDADFEEVIDCCPETDYSCNIWGPGLKLLWGVLEDSSFKADILDHMSSALPRRQNFKKVGFSIKRSDSRRPEDLVS